ncbi:hypothetical protein AAMO2058_000829900 [Amorphochlora amoebiformis]
MCLANNEHLHGNVVIVRCYKGHRKRFLRYDGKIYPDEVLVLGCFEISSKCVIRNFDGVVVGDLIKAASLHTLAQLTPYTPCLPAFISSNPSYTVNSTLNSTLYRNLQRWCASSCRCRRFWTLRRVKVRFQSDRDLT